MYTHQIIPVEHNYHIHVFDDTLPQFIRNRVYQGCRTSYFQLGWADSIVLERAAHNEFLHSNYTIEEFENLGIMPYLIDTPIPNMIAGLTINNITINLTTIADAHYVHTPPNQLVMLYYVNIEWMDGWHGETQFYTNTLKNIEYTSLYTPGRIIIFDGNIPHAMRPTSRIGPKFRYSLTVIFNKAPAR